MRSPLLAAFATVVLVSVLISAEDETQPLSVRLNGFTELSVPPKHLVPMDGRVFCRGPRSLRNHYPYICLSSPEERKKRTALELRAASIHQLLKPITTEAAALELAQLLSGGIVIESKVLFDAIIAAARKEAERLEHWGAKFEDGAPEYFGATVTPDGGDFVVRRLVLSCAGHGSIDVIGEEWRVRPDGPTTLKATYWLAGPPQSWQTSSFGFDEEAQKAEQKQQRAMRLEVTRFRAAVFAPIVAGRTADDIQRAAAALTFASVRIQLGEPDFEVHGRLYGSRKYEARYVYQVSDGTAFVFTSTGEDTKLASVRVVSGVKLGNDGSYELGAVIREL